MDVAIRVRYADTQRPAVGLTVEGWDGPRLGRQAVTDAMGSAGSFRPGLVLRFRRGQLVFTCPDIAVTEHASIIDIQPEHWPAGLLKLRQKLQEPSRLEALTRAANQVLAACHSEGLLEQLTNPMRRGEKPPSDNPHIIVGALLASLCITRLFRRYGPVDPAGEIMDPQSDEMWAIDSAIGGLRNWLEARKLGSRGYFLRWAVPLPYPGRTPTNWRAEPSLDEYSGLLLGLRWACELVPNVSGAPIWIRYQAQSWLKEISESLTQTNGWLVTPRDCFTARGPDLLANAFPLRCTLPEYRCAHPLRLDVPYVDTYIAASRQALEFEKHGGDAWADCAAQYEKTLEPILKVKEVLNTVEFWEWVAGLTSLPLLGPVGFVLTLVAINKINQTIDRLEDTTDEDLWGYCAKALGKPATVDGWGYNVHIFDRFSLAATWVAEPHLRSFLHDSFRTRATRPIGEDRWGWQLLGIGARVWLGADWSVDELVFAMDTNVKRLIPASSDLPEWSMETVEGFVLGWAITCLSLDLDPGIRWAQHVEQRFRERKPHGTMVVPGPRCRLRLEDVTLTRAKEPREECYGQVLLVEVDSTNGQSALVLPEMWGVAGHGLDFFASGQGSLLPGETRRVGMDLVWQLKAPGEKRDLILLLFAWEHDFTKGAQQNEAWGNTVQKVKTVLRNLLSPGYVLEKVAAQLQRQLQDWLPFLYPNPIARPGSRLSDDDFIGVQVLSMSTNAETVELHRDFAVDLSWTPKSNRRESAMRFRGSWGYKRDYCVGPVG